MTRNVKVDNNSWWASVGSTRATETLACCLPSSSHRIFALRGETPRRGLGGADTGRMWRAGRECVLLS